MTITEEIDGVNIVVDWIAEESCWRLTLEDSNYIIGHATRTALGADFFGESVIDFYPFHCYGRKFNRPGDCNVLNGEVGLRVPPHVGSNMVKEWNLHNIFDYAHNLIALNTPNDDIPV